ncbi:MAG: exonuclease domain-containing protein [Chloroflexi bacterium]|nr:exonuclease domain-containing protein [Chloroflexota bacterium]
MTLLPETTTLPLDEVYVALDIETTGLNPQRDAIIEVGAVRFRGGEELDTFHTLVNPFGALSEFVVELTGINQREVDAAPPFGAVASGLADFIGGSPVVGHNVAFDLAFLAEGGLNLTNISLDTQDMATVFLPAAKRYALSALSKEFGVAQESPHRALADARTCHRVFISLIELARQSGPGVLAGLAAVADRSTWPLRHLLRQLAGEASAEGRVGEAGADILGIDTQALAQRFGTHKSLRPKPARQPIDEDGVIALLEEGGPLSKAFPGYEQRPQQVEMAQAVTRALNGEHHLMVEAGTGVGKSVAYLLPAMLFALKNGSRVVISTNTINLQQQLVFKDIPALIAAVRGEDEKGPLDGLEYAHLKGRGNYLCFRRWATQAQSPGMTADEARMVAKTMVWLQDTATGDREELNIPARDAHLWDRLSARGAGECDAGRRGLCFLRAAHNRAQAAHVLVVNHALLLADLARGGGLLPSYDHLIVDEAHHLEEEASRQFGYQLTPRGMDELLESLARLIRGLRSVSSRPGSDSNGAPPWREDVERGTAMLDQQLPRLQEAWGRLASGLQEFLQHHHERSNDRRLQLRVTRSSRAQPGWSDLEVLWERFDEVQGETIRQAEGLSTMLEPVDYAPLASELTGLRGWLEEAVETRELLTGFVVQPQEETVYWMVLGGQEAMPILSTAPLDVGPILQERLFSKKESVVLTSATLSVQGSFSYLRERIGLSDTEELMLGSPFDYRKAALVLAPGDMPEPLNSGYQQGLVDSLVRVARASGGGVLGLFTSHAGLQTTRDAVRAALEGEEIEVLSQGIDGPPRVVVEAAAENPHSVLLGTASLWEGVDLPGDLLRVLVVARLPFPVPTEPLFAARSERYDDPFTQYALPQAVLRFRQGFGRLIRSNSDRGVVVVLDSRIVNKRYGEVFLNSIPDCTVRRVTIQALGTEVQEWLR